MLLMNRPLTSSKLLLVADPRQVTAAREKGGAIRRYRLARLRFDGQSAEHPSRFEHLKRVYD